MVREDLVAWPPDSNKASLLVVVSRGTLDLACADLAVKQHLFFVEIGSEKKVMMEMDVEMAVKSQRVVDSAKKWRVAVAAVLAERIDCLRIAEEAGKGTECAGAEEQDV